MKNTFSCYEPSNEQSLSFCHRSDTAARGKRTSQIRPMPSGPLSSSARASPVGSAGENAAGNAGEMAVSQERKLPENTSGEGLFLLAWQADAHSNKIRTSSPSTKVGPVELMPLSKRMTCRLFPKYAVSQMLYILNYN